MAEIYYGTGKRKDAVARVYLTPGSGGFTINGRPLEEYFPRAAHQKAARGSLSHPSVTTTFDVKVTAHGGGISGQADAVRHGIAVALVNMNEELRPSMREIGAMTRDPRVKERKKYGRKRARRGFQFSKR
jgi:small subunit ribosomal protein S9